MGLNLKVSWLGTVQKQGHPHFGTRSISILHGSTFDKAPPLALQLVVDKNIAHNTPIRIVVYDLDLYLATRGKELGDGLQYFTGAAAKSELVELPEAVTRSIVDGGALADAQKAGTGVLLYVQAKMLVRPPEDVKAFPYASPYFIQVTAPAANFRGKASYELALWMDQKTGDEDEDEEKARPIHKPSKWHGIMGIIRYPESDALALINLPYRRLVVRIVNAANAAPSITKPVQFISTMNGLSCTTGAPSPVHVDHSQLRDVLGAKPGTPKSTGALAGPMKRSVSPDRSGTYLELPALAKTPFGSPGFVSPGVLHVSQAGNALVGWYFPYRALGGFDVTAGDPLQAFGTDDNARGIFKAVIHPDKQSRASGAWKWAQSVSKEKDRERQAAGLFDPVSISQSADVNLENDTFRNKGDRENNLFFHRFLTIDIWETSPQLRLRVTLDSSGSWRSREVTFVRVSPHTRLPWTTVRGFLDPLRKAIVTSDIEPYPVNLLARDMAVQLSSANGVLQQAVDEFCEGKYESAFNAASTELEAILTKFLKSSDYTEEILAKFRLVAASLAITSKVPVSSLVSDLFGLPRNQSPTHSTLRWLEMILEGVIHQYLKTNTPEQARDLVFSQVSHKGRGYKLARLDSCSFYFYKLEFVSVAKAAVSEEGGGFSGGGEVVLVDVRGYEYAPADTKKETPIPLPGWELDAASTAKALEDRIKPIRYHGVLGTVGLGLAIPIKAKEKPTDSAVSGDMTGGGPTGVFKCVRKFQPSDFNEASFNITTLAGPSIQHSKFAIETVGSTALAMVTVHPDGMAATTMHAEFEKTYKDSGFKEVEGPDVKLSLEDTIKAYIEIKIHVASVSVTVGVFKQFFDVPPVKTPTVEKPKVPEQLVPTDLTMSTRVLFESDKTAVIMSARIQLEFLLATYRRLLQIRGQTLAIGYASPEYKETPGHTGKARIKLKEERLLALSRDRAASVLQAIQDAVGVPGGAVIHPGHSQTALGLGSAPALEVGLLLDPDDPEGACYCPSELCDYQRYPSPKRRPLNDPKNNPSGACTSSAHKSADPMVTPKSASVSTIPKPMPLVMFQELVQFELASKYVDWRIVDVMVHGMLMARLGAD